MNAAAAAAPAVFVDANLEPGRQALNIGREDVARRDRNTHAQDRLGEQQIRRRRARAVDVGELDDEVVNPFDGSNGLLHQSAASPRTARLGPATPRAPRWQTCACPRS